MRMQSIASCKSCGLAVVGGCCNYGEKTAITSGCISSRVTVAQLPQQWRGSAPRNVNNVGQPILNQPATKPSSRSRNNPAVTWCRRCFRYFSAEGVRRTQSPTAMGPVDRYRNSGAPIVHFMRKVSHRSHDDGKTHAMADSNAAGHAIDGCDGANHGEHALDDLDFAECKVRMRTNPWPPVACNASEPQTKSTVTLSAQSQQTVGAV